MSLFKKVYSRQEPANEFPATNSNTVGGITATIKDHVGGHVSEIEYTDKDGTVVGYWAYGHFDPNLPYKG